MIEKSSVMSVQKPSGISSEVGPPSEEINADNPECGLDRTNRSAVAVGVGARTVALTLARRKTISRLSPSIGLHLCYSF